MTEILIDKPEENQGYEIAKKRFRFLAFTIDAYIYGITGIIIGFLFGTPLEDEFGYSLKGIPAFGMIGIAFFLWPISEGIWGKTIGKRILKLKVVTNDFKPIGIRSGLKRFFIGFIDYMFFVGIIVASYNKQNKRIGDIIANTIVIRTRKSKS